MKKILVVDDDAEVLETIQLILEIGGYKVSPLNNGYEVLKRIEQFKPDLIILDISLGDIDGRELCEQLKATDKYSKIPILLISGLYNQEDFKMLNYGQDDFLSKPFKMDVLLGKITKAIAFKDDKFRYNIN